LLLGCFASWQISRADERQQVAKRQTSPSDAEKELVAKVNGLTIGATAEGALCWLLERGQRLDLVSDGLGAPDLTLGSYDGAQVVRVGRLLSPDLLPGKIYLYFRDGRLVYKCFTSDDEKANAVQVFQREILSGRQCPPNSKSLMARVHWSNPASPRREAKDAPGQAHTEQGQKRSGAIKIRCGIARAGDDPFAAHYGYEFLALYQNAGNQPLDADLFLLGFPGGPVAMLSATLAKGDLTSGIVNPLALFGTAVRPMDTGSKPILLRVAKFYLAPGESTYLWFPLSDPKAYTKVRAQFRGLQSQTATEILNWDAESPEIPAN
jgi:hypothetical protein